MDSVRVRRQLDSLIGKRKLAYERYKEEKSSLTYLEAQETAAVQAQQILQTIAQEVQAAAQGQVARIVSRCLAAVFENPYELRIEFRKLRGKTEAEFVYYRDGHRLDPAQTSGGVREVAGLALRLVRLTMVQPPVRKLLVLDEPFLGVSKSNLPRMAALIRTLSDELGVQFIIMTHEESLHAGKVVEL